MTQFTRVVKAKRMEHPRILRDPVLNHIHPRYKRKEYVLAQEAEKQDV